MGFRSRVAVELLDHLGELLHLLAQGGHVVRQRLRPCEGSDEQTPEDFSNADFIEPS